MLNIEELTTLEGRIKYLELLKDSFDKNDDVVDSSMMGLEILIESTVTDLHLLEFYKHKFGKISIKEFVDYMNKENTKMIRLNDKDNLRINEKDINFYWPRNEKRE